MDLLEDLASSSGDDVDFGSEEDNEREEDQKGVAGPSLLEMALESSSKFSIPTLRQAEWYLRCTGEVRKVLNVVDRVDTQAGDGGESRSIDVSLTGDLGNEHSSEYKLMVDSNKALKKADEAMTSTLTFIKGLYRARFPELEELVPNKVDYVRCAQRIGNETDMSKVKLSDILPSNTIMVVNVTGTMTTGTPLAPESLSLFEKACSEMLALSDDRDILLSFLESRMGSLAPNLSALIGAQVAASLIALAGTLTALSKIPGCNIEVMGHEQRTLQGMSMASSTTQYGTLINAPLVQSAPRSLRRKMIKVISGKVALMARMDAFNTVSDDSQGRRLYEEMESKLSKWQEPEKARTKKALPVPDEVKKKKRGGKRARRLKDRMAQTELASLRNRVSFTVGDNSEYGDSAMGVDMGMVGRKDTNKLRKPVEEKKSTLQLSKKARRALASSASSRTTTTGTDGMATSLAFSDSNGIELPPPPTAAPKTQAAGPGGDAKSSFFSSTAGFRM